MKPLMKYFLSYINAAEIYLMVLQISQYYLHVQHILAFFGQKRDIECFVYFFDLIFTSMISFSYTYLTCTKNNL